MTQQTDMTSPFTGGKVTEVFTSEIKEFRKEKYAVHVRYYVCQDTGEQFTTTEQDTLQFNDLYSQYRTRHGIPFPDEIKAIRKHYGLNYTQISKILGFGVNQYAKYEAGEVPSESNGKMIAAIRDKRVIINLLKDCKDLFQPTEYERILSSILMSEEKNDEYLPLYQIVYPDNGRSILNGFGVKSIPKLFDMIGYIVNKHGDIFPTKLNKLLFYSDFYNFRRIGQSISGLKYRALNYGPVPDHFSTIYDNTPNLDRRLLEAHGMVTSILSYSFNSGFERLSQFEKESIDHVVDKLRSLSVSEIIEASHSEDCWKVNSANQGYISYDRAYELKLV